MGRSLVKRQIEVVILDRICLCLGFGTVVKISLEICAWAKEIQFWFH
jgi:hypothetical protein